jgi:Lipopolysaccharide-assembly
MRMLQRRFLLGLFGACAIAASQGCRSSGYSWTSPYDTSIRSVAVPMFENQTFSPGLEVDVTDAVIKQIQRRTPWRVVTSGADATLNGRITSSKLRQLSIAPGSGLVQEMAVELAADFEFVDARTGKTIVSRQGFRAIDTFVPTRASGQEKLSVGELGASQRLADDLVSELRSSW